MRNLAKTPYVQNFFSNSRMIWLSNYVLTCVIHAWGGAAQYAEKAKRQKKHVINLDRGN
jgi:hypothetical protein